jgi:hypothetical protein
MTALLFGLAATVAAVWLLIDLIPEANRTDNGMAAMGAAMVAGVFAQFGILGILCIGLGVVLLSKFGTKVK